VNNFVLVVCSDFVIEQYLLSQYAVTNERNNNTNTTTTTTTTNNNNNNNYKQNAMQQKYCKQKQIVNADYVTNLKRQ
jgi:glucose dehydrogenase